VPTLSSRVHALPGSGSITFVGAAAGAAGRADRVEWGVLFDDARGVSASLQARGVGPGSRVAVLGPTTRPLVTALTATWLAGATVVALPLPMRLGSVDAFVEQTVARIEHADVGLVVVDRDLAPYLPPRPAGAPVALLDELAPTPAAARRYAAPPDEPDRLAILQYTSGSTSDPKGVMLPDRCVLENIDAIVEGAAIGEGDRAVSWLPLYHDMGLIGLLLTPMLHGFELVLGAPQDFLASPATWLQWMSEMRGTVTAGPNFSYALAARALRRAGTGSFDLSSWRLALNGAEPVDPDAVDAFCAAGAPHRLSATAACPVFGMAEATLAVTFPLPGTGMTVDPVDRLALERERYAAPAAGSDARRLAVLGRPLRGFELRVVDPDTHEPIAAREVGELELRGPSLTPGYFRNPAATSATFHDGWLRTGDLAYLVDGELVVCGRLKDVIIVGGRNVFPEDVERAAAAVEGVRAGNVIAFGAERRRGTTRSGEALVVVAETRADGGLDSLRDAVAATVRDAVGIPPADVVLVRSGTLPKTSSGKLQRSLCRDRYHGHELESV
jgi:fatty-acyl-CoA synthase